MCAVDQGRAGWGAAGAQMTGTPSAHGGGNGPGGQPWDVILGNAPHSRGKEGKANAEITPLEASAPCLIWRAGGRCSPNIDVTHFP
jgi:hypothetical protein